MLSSFELNLSVAPAERETVVGPGARLGRRVRGRPAPGRGEAVPIHAARPCRSRGCRPRPRSRRRPRSFAGGRCRRSRSRERPPAAGSRKLEVEPKAGKSEELEAEGAACPEARETRDACPWARESTWVELVALPAADASPARCCATWRPEAEPRVSSEMTTRATIAVAPTTLRRRHGRPKFLPVLICALLPSLVGRSTLLAQPLALP